jgi:hypothetical protein
MEPNMANKSKWNADMLNSPARTKAEKPEGRRPLGIQLI